MPAGPAPASSIRLSLFYARSNGRDRSLREELEQRLHSLERDDHISIWCADTLLPGESVIREATRHLQEAHIILLLVNQALLAPEYYNSQEMQVILQRYKAGEVHVIPILLSPIAGLKGTWFGELQALPVDNQPKPISRWSDRELALANVLKGIRRVIIFIQEVRNQLSSYRWLIEEPDLVHSDTISRESVVHDLYSRLLRQDTTVLVLSGIAGSGKSTLAHLVYEYAEDLRQAGKSPFTGEALWLTIDAATTLNDIAGTLFEAFHQTLPYIPHIQHPIQPRELAIQLFNMLNSVDKPRLIVLDQFEHLLDARDEAYLLDVAEWLQLLSRRPCRCHLLLTSRIWPTHSYGASSAYLQEYPTRGLETAEGIAFLQSRPIAASSQALETIVLRWQGHPKALSSLAKLLMRQQKSLDDFLTDYQSIEGENSLFAFLDYLYFRQLDEPQRGLLFAFAIFREPVSLYAAQTLIGEGRPELTAEFQAVLDELLALRLLETKQGYYHPHTLIAEYALTHLIKDDEHAPQEAVCKAHIRAAQYYQQQFALISPPQEVQRRIGDVHNLIEAIWHLCKAEQWHQAYTLIVRERLFTDLQRLGSNMTLLELYRLLFPLEQWQSAPSEAAQIHAELGSIYHHLGRKEEARNELERALHLFESVDEHAGVIFTLNTLGEVYRALGMPARAVTCYEQALTLSEQIQGDQAIQLKGIALNNLGSVYHTLKQLNLAASYYEQALSFHLDTNEAAVTRNNLGQLYETLKRPEEAHRSYRQALRGFQDVGDRRGEATTLMNLGSYCRKRGDPEQALSYYGQSIRLFQEIGDPWGEVSVLRNLAHLYRRQKSYRAALACLFLAGTMLKELHSARQREVEELIALLRHELGQNVFEALAAEVSPEVAQIVEETLRRNVPQQESNSKRGPDMSHTQQANKSLVSPNRISAFISYSNADRKYLEELKGQLAYYIRKWNLKVWDDTQGDRESSYICEGCCLARKPRFLCFRPYR